MERHVIKGRGKNRGKYLCRAVTAGRPPGGFVWLQEQRKATRWADPRYSDGAYGLSTARDHDGYFVKLVCPKGLDVPTLKDFIATHSAGAAEKVPCYWFGIDFHDASEDFCLDCAEELVDSKYAADPAAFDDLYPYCKTAEERYRAAIDGGFDIDHDGHPYCHSCEAKLSGTLTDYGASEIISVFTRENWPAFDDVEGWNALDDAIMNLVDDDPRWRAIARVVEAAREGEREHAAAQSALAASPGMAGARASLLGLLHARAEQKAPDPSFRLWRKMCRWDRLPFARTYRPTRLLAAVEKRLVREAKNFARALGWRTYWSCSTFMIDAPYGAGCWSFVIRLEQYRLWNPPAFQEGRAYMLHPCPSGDPNWPHRRDANPYPKGSEEHRQWDCGYMGTARTK